MAYYLKTICIAKNGYNQNHQSVSSQFRYLFNWIDKVPQIVNQKDKEEMWKKGEAKELTYKGNMIKTDQIFFAEITGYLHCLFLSIMLCKGVWSTSTFPPSLVQSFALSPSLTQSFALPTSLPSPSHAASNCQDKGLNLTDFKNKHMAYV